MSLSFCGQPTSVTADRLDRLSAVIIRRRGHQIVEYIVHNGVMKDLSVLQESPFTDRGSIVEVFTDLSVWLSIKKVIDQIKL